ncbi:cysteine--tRNA ligase 2, cytoplasmic isoform X2 [Manihot esculenta]|nr:cysteine--tRNA ligase 2, cytoplasmic isoform X2 [Manihot esculenta]
MDSLQCLHPTYQPRVTDHMEEIIDMIKQIIDNGFAYDIEGDVFFAVDKFPNYGQLSGQKLENTRAGERVAVDTRKRNPADFALWKAAKPDEPSWKSPWGDGRPGWHIECSAMSAHYLTSKFDIHGGGSDLAFPHHENEIAQSAAARQESHVSYWMHNGHVTNNNEKMSKSLGNFFTIRQVTERYHPLALRYFLMSAHYRSPLNYTVLQLESASDAIFYIYQTLHDCEEALSLFQDGSQEGVGLNVKKVGITADAQKCINKLREEFESKMSDDLSTSHILIGAFQEALKFINSSLSMIKKKQQKQQQLSLIQSLTEIEKEAKLILKILGLLPPCTYVEVLQQLKDKALKRAGLTEQDVLSFIEERAMARKNKDFSRSDQIRADLTAKGIALMDVGKETVWRPCVPVEAEQDAPSVVAEQKQNPLPAASS